MKSFKENMHSFIVRVWLEPRELENVKPQLRGEIKHVESGEGRGLKDLDQITAFIATYFRKMGDKMSGHQKSRKWFKRWNLSIMRRH